MGQVAAAAAAAMWVRRVSGVVVCGVAGGCGGAAGTGDVVVASGLVDGAGTALPGVAAGVEVPGTICGVIASVAVPVDSAAGRAALLAVGAVAVEMEAAAWAEECSARGVPLVVVRAVLDTPDVPLGALAGMVALGATGPSVAAVAREAARPGRWGELMRMGRIAAGCERLAAQAAVRAAEALRTSR